MGYKSRLVVELVTDEPIDPMDIKDYIPENLRFFDVGGVEFFEVRMSSENDTERGLTELWVKYPRVVDYDAICSGSFC